MKALVRKADDKVERIHSASDVDTFMSSTPYQQVYYSLDVPLALQSKPVSELVAVLVPVQNEYWSDGVTNYNAIVDVPQIDDGTGTMIADPSFIHYPLIVEHKEIQIDIAVEKSNKIAELKSIARDEIYAELLAKFGSQDPANVNANFTTWKEMLVDPISFVGTFSTHEAYDSNGVVLIFKGSKLVDASMVVSYATELVRLSKEYMVFRVNKYKELSDSVSSL